MRALQGGEVSANRIDHKPVTTKVDENLSNNTRQIGVIAAQGSPETISYIPNLFLLKLLDASQLSPTTYKLPYTNVSPVGRGAGRHSPISL
jgi:hypothetical protein